MTSTKIIVIDDDPTGSQTVHSCLLLTRWDEQTIVHALRDGAPLFFILSNEFIVDRCFLIHILRTVICFGTVNIRNINICFIFCI